MQLWHIIARGQLIVPFSRLFITMPVLILSFQERIRIILIKRWNAQQHDVSVIVPFLQTTYRPLIGRDITSRILANLIDYDHVHFVFRNHFCA